MFLRNCWQVAAQASEVGRKLLARRLLDEAVILYRTEAGQAVAMADRCPHRYVPLSLGELVGDAVRCGYHGITLGPDGKCSHVPGQTSVPALARARIYPVVERHLLIWIWLGEPDLADPELVPDVGWIDAPGWTPCAGYHHFDAEYRLVSDNLLDLSHETYVHKETIGNGAVADAPVRVAVDGQVVRAFREMPDIEPPPFFTMLLGGPGRINRWQTAMWAPPGINMTEAGVHFVGTRREDAFVSRVYHLLTPETAHSTHYFWVLARNYRLDDTELTRNIHAAVVHTFNEDAEVLRLQDRGVSEQPGAPFPGVVFVIDGAPIQARRILADMWEREQTDKRRGVRPMAVA
jgi:phenylpropionate dioxygenase-like ring-hydroxylating dioxygenase large terminal subunit